MERISASLNTDFDTIQLEDSGTRRERSRMIQLDQIREKNERNHWRNLMKLFAKCVFRIIVTLKWKGKKLTN